MLSLYNSATHRHEEFHPHDENRVGMYTCGPTVYHYAHIGNLRTYIMEDVLDRYLRYSGYNLKRVMNITDVGHLSSDADEGEDKMVNGAKREHKSVLEIAKFYTDAFLSDCERLNIRLPDVIEPATHCIDDYIRIISRLIETGYAYIAGGNVYFDTSKLDEYYVFNKHSEENLAVGVREGVEADDNKKNKADFVLWFTKSKFDAQELKWESPWGLGYPGWHIECSAISLKHLGEYLDIHCGGIDNQFPHHTNEIAQSEAYIGHKWCGLWFHVHHLNTESGKMSKSSGEFLTLTRLSELGYSPMAYRFFCLNSHYRKTLVFSDEALDNAVGAYEKLLSRIAAILPDGNDASGEYDRADFEKYKSPFVEALDGDLNTSLAVTAVYDVLKAPISNATKTALIEDFDRVLALDLIKGARESREKTKKSDAAAAIAGDDDGEILAAIAARAEAKAQKNYAEADRIRAELLARGITLIDTREGTTYKKTT
ncbi:MAG: cysteine--tRNA ligase [Firmicutes bacterium]|nr:cysteine--tRNA ligase [Bacillota bacterium]